MGHFGLPIMKKKMFPKTAIFDVQVRGSMSYYKYKYGNNCSAQFLDYCQIMR